MRKIVLFFLFVLLTLNLQAREWWVNPECHNLSDTTIGTTNLNGDSCNIVVAFQNASYGDVIYLQQGHYSYGDDYTTASPVWLTLNDSNIAVIGVGKVVLDGNNNKRILKAIYCDSITIKNVEFRNGYGYQTDGTQLQGVALILNYSTNVLIENCIFKDNYGYSNAVLRGVAICGLYMENTTIKECVFEKNKSQNASSTSYTEHIYGGVIDLSLSTNCKIINNTFFRNIFWNVVSTSTHSNAGVIMYCYNTFNLEITNNIIAFTDVYQSPYTAYYIYCPKATYGQNNVFYNNDFAPSSIDYYYEGINLQNTLEIDPEFVDDNLFCYLQDTSPLVNAGAPYVNIYHNIGGLSKAKVYGEAETYAWQGWIDENGDTISEGLSSIFYIDNYDSSLRLYNQYDTGIAYSPIIYVGENPRYFSVDIEVEEYTDLVAGQKQCIDFDETTQEREIQWREGNTPAEVLSASWNNAVANRNIEITKKYIQIRLKFNKLVEY